MIADALARIAGNVRAWFSSSHDPQLLQLFGATPTPSGVTISENVALTASAWWCGITTIAGDVASLPLHFYKRLANGGKERFTSHPCYWLLHDEPNDFMSAETFRETVTASALMRGNGYAEITFDAKGRPAALYPLEPWRVQPFWLPPNYKTLAYRIDGTTVLPPYRVLHLRGLSHDGIMGYDLLHYAQNSIGLALALEAFQSTYFANGTFAGGVITHPGRMTDKARDRFLAEMDKRHKGVALAHRLLLLEEGLKYDKATNTPEDSQALEARTYQILEIARFLNLPPHMLMELTHATFSNIEHQTQDYLNRCLRRWLVKWEQELQRKLVAPLELGIQFFEHLVDGFLRADTASRYAAYAVGRQWGWLSANDIRERENMNPIKGGDVYLVPLNMTSSATGAPPPAPAPSNNGGGTGGPPDGGGNGNGEPTAPAARDAYLLHMLPRLEDLDRRVMAVAERTPASALAGEVREAVGELRDAVDQVAERLAAEGVKARGAAEETREALTAIVERVAALEAAERMMDSKAAERHEALAETVGQVTERIGTEMLNRVSALEAARKTSETRADERHAELEETVGELTEQIRTDSDAAARTIVDTMAALGERVAALEAAGQVLEAKATERHEILERTVDLAERLAADRPAPEPVNLAPITDRLEALGTELVELASAQAAATDHARDVAEHFAERTDAFERRTAALAERSAAFAERSAALEKRSAAMLPAVRAMIEEAYVREVRVEADRARKAARAPDTFGAWVGTFYSDRAQVSAEHMLVKMRVAFGLIGRSEQAEADTRALLEPFVAAARAELEALASSRALADDVAAVVARWETSRPPAVADALLRVLLAAGEDDLSRHTGEAAPSSAPPVVNVHVAPPPITVAPPAVVLQVAPSRTEIERDAEGRAAAFVAAGPPVLTAGSGRKLVERDERGRQKAIEQAPVSETAAEPNDAAEDDEGAHDGE